LHLNVKMCHLSHAAGWRADSASHVPGFTREESWRAAQQGHPVRMALLLSQGPKTPPGAAVMEFRIYTQSLIPRYLFRKRVLAWQCSVCRKIFSILLDEAEHRSELTAPEYVFREFRQHNCAVILVERQERREAVVLAEIWTQ